MCPDEFGPWGKIPFPFKASFLKIPLNYQTFTISKVKNHLKVV